MLRKVTEIVRKASELMLDNVYEISQKEGYSNIVTTSDVAVQEFLRSNLADLYPDSGFLCEEEDQHDLTHEYTWIIDPIDGTANYSRNIRECAICVGLKHNAEMKLAVVYLPRTGEMFTAERGKGACLNGQRINVSKRPFGDAVLCAALAVYHKEHAQVCSDIIVDAFMQCNDIRRFGAAAPELCYVAMGRCEMYFEYILSPWDYAAASLILTEAGGAICQMDGTALNPTLPAGVVAANNQENLERMVSIVRKHI